MDTHWYRHKITTVANAHSLSPFLVEAICWVESRGRVDAFRHEPQFWDRYHLADKPEYSGMNPRRVSSSYGLMQIMYPVARELGFQGEPEMLFQIAVNLHWGCKKLREISDWANSFNIRYPDRLRAIAAAYNGGKGGNAPGTPLRNGVYADRVIATINVLTAPPPVPASVIHA